MNIICEIGSLVAIWLLFMIIVYYTFKWCVYVFFNYFFLYIFFIYCFCHCCYSFYGTIPFFFLFRVAIHFVVFIHIDEIYYLFLWLALFDIIQWINRFSAKRENISFPLVCLASCIARVWLWGILESILFIFLYIFIHIRCMSELIILKRMLILDCWIQEQQICIKKRAI